MDVATLGDVDAGGDGVVVTRQTRLTFEYAADKFLFGDLVSTMMILWMTPRLTRSIFLIFICQ